MANLGVTNELSISIHALREEGDKRASEKWDETRKFLSTPSARRATDDGADRVVQTKFLSTPSARRATWTCRPCCRPGGYFYPRPPRGGRPNSNLIVERVA